MPVRFAIQTRVIIVKTFEPLDMISGKAKPILLIKICTDQNLAPPETNTLKNIKELVHVQSQSIA